MNNNTDHLTLIFVDGKRHHVVLAKGEGTSWRQQRDQRNDDLAKIGREFVRNPEHLAASVLICGTEIHVYSANETREVLGL